MKTETASGLGALIAVIAYFALIGAAVYGWIVNIITIAHSNFSELTGLLILRVIGIFVAPLGAVLGYVG